MSPLLLTILTFLAVITLVFAVASVLSDLFLRDRERVSQRIDDEFRKKQRERAERSLVFKDLGRLAAEVDTDQPSLQVRVEELLDQSGLEMTSGRLFSLMGGSALALGILGGLIRENLLVGAVGAVVGAALPWFYVLFKRMKRLNKLREQLPDAFDLMSRVVRAGQTISQAQQAVADEFTPPIASEFAYCFEQQNLGLSPEIALRDLARRTGLLEIKIFVTALLVQQQTGGNLAELLEKLSGVVRERFKTQGKIRALTAEGRIQGLVLLFLPVGMFLIMLVLNREFSEVLLDYPYLLLGMAVSEGIGALWIRKIVNFDF